MIDLRRLRTLRAVSYYGTVTAAAESLHMTPSAASQQIRQLGKDLGVELLVRQGRGVRLSGAARKLLEHADQIYNQWTRAEAEIRSLESPELGGTLTICGFPSAVSNLLSPASAALQEGWPLLAVQILEAEPSECFDLLFAGEADLGVVEVTRSTPALDDRRFFQRDLADDPFDVLISERHPLASKREMQLLELARDPWIVAMPGASSRDYVLAACTQAGFAPRIAHQAREWGVVASLVGFNLGVALIPRSVSLQENGVVRVPISGSSTPSRHLMLATVRGNEHRAEVATASAYIQKKARQLLHRPM